MRTILIFLAFTLLTVSLFAQDTLYMKKGKVIPCKVTEIGIDEIKYKDFDNLEGPNYVIHKLDVIKIVYQNGKTEMIFPDEMSMNKEEEIVDKNQCIKVAFMSPIFNHIEIGYERKLKMTKNLELRFGFIGINNNGTFLRYDNAQGGYGSGGIKFLLGQDYYIKGMKYLHPLKGSYLKPELSIAVIDFTQSYYNYNYYSHYTTYIKYRTSMFALNMIYGKQFILGNVLTFDMHIGIGYGFVYTSQKNNKNLTNSYEPFIGYYGSNIVASKDLPISLTGGFTIGYLFK